ncbi:CobQ/CobB/MinD/ParA nucleotide binding domain protein [Acididesulfobacillus acetoxydans]|uniref:non-specific protein-tyrosine kinase n=1 Tax=Acididesulfobacillus acetoxydans TaxID=1561005 RepID=A0A8S0X7B2_9FIRM|nr:CobQ/CobB/MinD/ParA nucleotide binding domain protein [Acididesulfobacillus acetoxydans]CEJ07602.1 Tyrosine-protein kinase YwqD [Acididesulfobacillus acetoxydans]
MGLSSLITARKPKSPISEAYRTLRTNVQFTAVDGEVKKILVTSAGPGEGKSATAANLAVSMAEAGQRVLIIDGDLRNPTQHKLFGLSNLEGLSTALVQEKAIRELIRETKFTGLTVLSSGPIPPNPAELLNSKRMKRFLEEAAEEFDTILIDTPPVIAVADASILAQSVDGVILVLASGEVNREYALRAKEQLEKVGAKLLGAVLNKVEMKTREHYYYYYYGHEHKKRRDHAEGRLPGTVDKSGLGF